MAQVSIEDLMDIKGKCERPIKHAKRGLAHANRWQLPLDFALLQPYQFISRRVGDCLGGLCRKGKGVPLDFEIKGEE
jgi:hypothetical protein